jgi:hypothetical protein
LSASWPNPGTITGFVDRAVLRTEADYHRHATVNGTAIVNHDYFTSPAPGPSYLGLGAGDGQWFGQTRRANVWRRALTDAEMLQAFGGL